MSIAYFIIMSLIILVGTGLLLFFKLYKKYDYNNEKFTYLKPYYDFTFYEMGLKIACLKYYYKKYFLPLHLKIHSASIAHKVYTNDIKFNNEVYKTILSEHPILLGNMKEYLDLPNYHNRVL